MSEPDDRSFEALLEFLERMRGADFTGYKRPSLMRRVRRRMEATSCASFGDYLDYLEVTPAEYELLFAMLLINVTAFFRDPPVWEHLRDAVLPSLLAAKGPVEPIRVWSAGCATGQEAYTAGIVLAELLGVEEYRRRVKIYATDIDEEALGRARLATYAGKEAESVPAELRERYFERADQRLAFRKELRRTIIFGHNNLVQDAPISHLDLLICRNTLMYLTAETQGRIVRHFHFALNDFGVLMLGTSEMMIAHRELFAATDPKQRIFVKQPRTTMASRAAQERPSGDDDRAGRAAALELGPHAQVIVSHRGRMTFANLAARTLFQISREDIGRPFAGLPLAHRPPELLAAVEQALRERRRVALGEQPFTPDGGDPRRLDVTVTPLVAGDNAALGASVSFEDVTRYAALQTELEGNRRDLELAYEELQSTIDELETTTRSCSRPTRSCRRPTRSCSPPTRSSSPPTRSSRRSTTSCASGPASSIRSTTSSRRSSRRSRSASRCSTRTSASRAGTGAPRTSGACARTRPSTTISSAWTSGCPPSSSRRRCGRC